MSPLFRRLSLLAAVICLLTGTLAALAAPATGTRPAHLTAAAAYAVQLENIAIDGDLSDWPRDMVHHPVLINYDAMGPSKLDGLDLRDNPECCAYFMVGYSAKENTLYVAVVVREKSHVVGNHWDQTDAVEVYVMGDKGRIAHDPGATAMQFSGVAGNGTYAEDGHNFSLLQGNVAATASKFAFSRKGDLTVYEFALKPYDDFAMFAPGVYRQPTRLVPGKRLGFDIGIAYKDETANPMALLFWASVGSEKYSDPALLGEVELLAPGDHLSALEGRITRADDAKPYADLDLEAWQLGAGPGDAKPGGVVRTDARGHYRLSVPAGKYRIQPVASSGAAPGQTFGTETGRDESIAVAAITLPPALARAAKRYATLKTYTDHTTIRISTPGAGGTLARQDLPLDFAFERPNRLRLSSASPLFHNILVTSDGTRIAGMRDNKAVGPPMPAPSPLTTLALYQATGGLSASINEELPTGGVRDEVVSSGGLVGGLFAHRLMLRGDPVREILDHADRIEEIGPAVIDGQPVTLVEVTKAAAWVLDSFPYRGTRRGLPVTFQLAIGDKDDLIHQFFMQYDLSQALGGTVMTIVTDAPASRILTWTVKHTDIRVDGAILAGSQTFTVPPVALVNAEKAP